MRNKNILNLAAALLMVVLTGTAVFAQSPVPAIQNRIAQQVVINSQRVDGALVLTAAGGIQSYTCPAPQQYITADGASQGWACYDPTTGVWLLSALPPQQQAPAPAPVVLQQAVMQPVYAPPTVIYSYPVSAPAVIYQEPAVIYASPVYPTIVERVYSPSFAIGVAAINAGGRIAAAMIERPRFYDHREIRIVHSERRR
jgi:hypothetical protein